MKARRPATKTSKTKPTRKPGRKPRGKVYPTGTVYVAEYTDEAPPKDEAQPKDTCEITTPEQLARKLMAEMELSGSMMPHAVRVDGARKEYNDIKRAMEQGQQQLHSIDAQIESLVKARDRVIRELEVVRSDLNTASIVLRQQVNGLRDATFGIETYYADNGKCEDVATPCNTGYGKGSALGRNY